MIAGAIAGSATVLITNPIWVINTRMTTRQSSNETLPTSSSPNPQKSNRKPSTISTLLSVLRTEGPSALFAGVLPALVLVINPILQYTIFEQLKNALESRRKRGIGARDSFLLGAIGKLLATGITYPYITVKSRMHVAGKGAPREGMGESVRRVIREEGWGGLYKGKKTNISTRAECLLMLFLTVGIGPKVTQSVITAAFLFAFKDALYDASVQLRRRVPAKIPAK